MTPPFPLPSAWLRLALMLPLTLILVPGRALETPDQHPALVQDAARNGGALAERPLRNGDKLIWQVEEDGDLPVTLVVLDSGEVQLPYLGPLPAAGHTPSAFTRLATAELERDLYRRATIRLTIEQVSRESRLGAVFLTGQVRKPGPVQIDPTQTNTVSKVVLAAGGLADFADGRNVRLVRATRPGSPPQTTLIDVAAILQRGEITRDLPVVDGDLLIVPEKRINW